MRQKSMLVWPNEHCIPAGFNQFPDALAMLSAEPGLSMMDPNGVIWHLAVGALPGAQSGEDSQLSTGLPEGTDHADV